ncbi:hypothetical protein Bind_0789 [Beijerinckia indica subsp. indica ATCC 9039]|uniref:Uncharacterized protein n=1 Tax=Beijerinckia indica subsp. indica (strain ATCC 9039 / DSM 1715 / NCIMB 8712) TaxID=395963 RepID=B2IH25_BEII9|nr:hypothetical protein Bind_0789 [Beijerinckia indica subsp. indica ATCC 9039]
MDYLGKLMGAAALGGALMFSGMASAQENIIYVAPGSGPLSFAHGMYYPPGTPLVTAPESTPGSPLMTGRSAAIGVVGNHCTTPTKTCLLYHSSVQNGGCSCKTPSGRSYGTVSP